MTDNPKPVGAVTLSLADPVPANGEMVSELVFRKPTAGDMIQVGGNPVLIDMNALDPASTIRFDARLMGEMLSRLAGVPPSTIARLDTNDFAAACWRVSDFFLPVQRVRPPSVTASGSPSS